MLYKELYVKPTNHFKGVWGTVVTILFDTKSRIYQLSL